MTNREFLTNVANGTITDAEITHATEALAKMDAANEKRKNRPSKKAEENAPLMDQIFNEVLSAEAVPAATVAETIGVSVQKANALLRALVAEGRAVATDVKMPKRGTVKAYTKVDTED